MTYLCIVASQSGGGSSAGTGTGGMGSRK